MKIQQFGLAISISILTFGPLSAAPLMPDIFADGDVVLFQGDSITHGGRGGDMNHYLGHGYAAEIAMRYLAYAPDRRIEFANRGVSGDTSARILARWDRDGANFTAGENGYSRAFGCGTGDVARVATWLSVLCGVNERGGADGAARAKEYGANLAEIVRRSRAANAGINLVICEPFRVPQSADPDYLRIQDEAARVAWELKIPLVSFQRFFNEQLAAENPRAGYWSWDGIHPTYAAHMRMADFWLESVAAAKASPRSANTAIYPRAKLENDSYDWWARHSRILREQAAMDPEIVFIGDSITHFWAGRETIGGADAEPRWKKAFGAYRTLNAGFGWDRTQNVLWRLDHGLLDGTKPKVISLMIGSNNVGAHNAPANTAEEIFEATRLICARLHEKAPQATIVLSNILPRGEKPGNIFRTKPMAVNAMLERWAAGRKGIEYVKVYDEFLTGDGTLTKDVAPDFCHPSDKGYEIWTAALLPRFRKALGR